jgi:hypothetical protein
MRRTRVTGWSRPGRRSIPTARSPPAGTATRIRPRRDWLATGIYEVDFTPLATDIRGRPRSATLNAAAGAVQFGFIQVADNFNHASSVFVSTGDRDGTPTDQPFALIVY